MKNKSNIIKLIVSLIAIITVFIVILMIGLYLTITKIENKINESPEVVLAKSYFDEIINEEYSVVYYDKTLFPYRTIVSVKTKDEKTYHAIILKNENTIYIDYEKSSSLNEEILYNNEKRLDSYVY